MASLVDTQIKNSKLGNDAGYVLDFFSLDANGLLAAAPMLSVSSESHYASLDANLLSGLGGGRYEVTIEGLEDDAYLLLQKQRDEQMQWPVMRLYMYWRDVNQSVKGYLANLAGIGSGLSESEKPLLMIAELQVMSVQRRIGQRRYETRLTAIERVMYQLRRTRMPVRQEAYRNYNDAIVDLTKAAKVESSVHLKEVVTPQDFVFNSNPRASCAKGLEELATSLEQATRRRGRGMLLIRNGTLVVGPRPIPMGVELPPADLSPSNGLIEVQVSSQSETATLAPIESEASGTSHANASTSRPRYTIVCKGRPDLKPGDLVRFDMPQLRNTITPSVGQSLAGVFAGSMFATESMENPHIAYVEAVQHSMGRVSGFTTILTAVGTPSAEPDDVWDAPDATNEPESPMPMAAAGDPGLQAAAAIRRMQDSNNRRCGLAIGEVRVATASSSIEPVSQTETLWCGLSGPDGNANQARRLPIARNLPAVKNGVTYLSPFAWGKCGLIVPRYPGMRVAVGFHNGSPSDALDMGALWETGSATGESQAGDWWLSLPAKVPLVERSSIDSDTTPKAYMDVVSNDLIDADGHRVIEVGELTIRIAETDKLSIAGARPKRTTEAGSITIEHAKNQARIVIKPDGSIEIAGKRISLDASDGTLELKAKTIQMTADKVDVSVNSEMNVH